VKRAYFSPAAAFDLEDAARRVDRARPGWGDKLHDEVLEVLERIEEYVEAWQTFDEQGPERRFVLRRFPCIVVYLVTATGIQVTAVVYGGREPGYWRNRR
jgi:plasmid stabilization system protein ParE